MKFNTFLLEMPNSVDLFSFDRCELAFSSSYCSKLAEFPGTGALMVGRNVLTEFSAASLLFHLHADEDCRETV